MPLACVLASPLSYHGTTVQTCCNWRVANLGEYACKKEVSDTQELLDSFKTKNEEIVKGEEACHTVRVTARAPEPSAEDPARGQDQAGEYQH